MKMIKIDDKYHVTVDELNLTLRKQNPGSSKIHTIGYFSNWEDVFSRLIKQFVSDELPDKAVSIKELRGIYSDVKKHVLDLLVDLKGEIRGIL